MCVAFLLHFAATSRIAAPCGPRATTWTLLKLALAGAIACIVSLRRHDVVFPRVVAWAARGISMGAAETPAVSGAATTIMLLAVLVALYEAQRRYRPD